MPDLPSRYESLITRLALNAADPQVIVATQRIESRRLKSEGDLRHSLTDYLRCPDDKLGRLCPRDLISAYQRYATETFGFAGEAYSGLFFSQEEFASALTVVTEWIIEEIVPGPQTVRERLEHHMAFPAKVLALGQKVGLTQDADAALLAEAMDFTVLSDLLGTGQLNLEIDASILDHPIIPLDEPVSHFCERTDSPNKRGEFLELRRGGLWETLIDGVNADLVRTEVGGFMSYFYIRELEFALRSKANRDTAEEILRVAMECRLPYALQRWWELSHEREGGAGSKNSVSRGKKKSPVKSSVGDATFLQGKEAVSYQHAEAYLGVSARWRQHLVKTGTLIASGKASRRQITTKSLFEYQPPLKAK